jgi:hypothetical protein
MRDLIEPVEATLAVISGSIADIDELKRRVGSLADQGGSKGLIRISTGARRRSASWYRSGHGRDYVDSWTDKRGEVRKSRHLEMDPSRFKD